METELCENWQILFSGKEIPAQSITLHSIHCARNFVKCHCGEVVSKSDQAAHNEQFHTPKPCPLCHQLFQPALLPHHDCPKQPRVCQYCQASFPADQISAHVYDCGNRTQQCHRCGKYIPLRDYQAHIQQMICNIPQPIPVNRVSHSYPAQPPQIQNQRNRPRGRAANRVIITRKKEQQRIKKENEQKKRKQVSSQIRRPRRAGPRKKMDARSMREEPHTDQEFARKLEEELNRQEAERIQMEIDREIAQNQGFNEPGPGIPRGFERQEYNQGEQFVREQRMDEDQIDTDFQMAIKMMEEWDRETARRMQNELDRSRRQPQEVPVVNNPVDYQSQRLENLENEFALTDSMDLDEAMMNEIIMKSLQEK